MSAFVQINDEEYINFFSVGKIFTDEDKLEITYETTGGRRIVHVCDDDAELNDRIAAAQAYISSGGGGGGGASDYGSLTGKPKINGVTLTGNKTSQQLMINPPNLVLVNSSGTFTQIKAVVDDAKVPYFIKNLPGTGKTQYSWYYKGLSSIECPEDTGLSEAGHAAGNCYAFWASDGTIEYFYYIYEDNTWHIQAKKVELNYTSPKPVADNIGGIKKGTVFTNEPISNVLDKLFSPAYTKPSVIVNVDCALLNDPTIVSLNSVKITPVIQKGTENIAWVKYYINNTLVNTINEPASLTPVYTYNFPSVTNETFKVKVEVSDVDTGSVVSAEKTVKFIPGMRSGSLANGVDINATTVGTLTYRLQDKIDSTWVYTTPYGRFVLAYPKVLGTLTSCKDEVNNFNYIDSITRSEITLNGYEYYLIYLTDPAGFTDLSITYK